VPGRSTKKRAKAKKNGAGEKMRRMGPKKTPPTGDTLHKGGNQRGGIVLRLFPRRKKARLGGERREQEGECEEPYGGKKREKGAYNLCSPKRNRILWRMKGEKQESGGVMPVENVERGTL